MHSLRWVWGDVGKYQARLVIGLFLALIVSALNMLNPYLAGKIVDIDKGKLLEEGSHEELMNKKGHYWKLHNSQQLSLNIG